MEILEERSGFRLRLELDEYPPEPYDEGASPLLRIDKPGWWVNRAVHVDTGDWDRARVDPKVENAALRLFDKYREHKALALLERYLRAFFGVTSTETYDSGSYLYVTYDPSAWRQAVGAPEGSVSLTTYRAWCEGDCWSWVIERRETWHAASDATRTLQRWEVVDSCSGFYGSEWAEQAARDAFAYLLSKEGADDAA